VQPTSILLNYYNQQYSLGPYQQLRPQPPPTTLATNLMSSTTSGNRTVPAPATVNSPTRPVAAMSYEYQQDMHWSALRDPLYAHGPSFVPPLNPNSFAMWDGTPSVPPITQSHPSTIPPGVTSGFDRDVAGGRRDGSVSSSANEMEVDSWEFQGSETTIGTRNH